MEKTHNAYQMRIVYIDADIPNDTPDAKKEIRKFKKFITRNQYYTGAVMQFNGRFVGLIRGPFDKTAEDVKSLLPPDANIRLLGITDKQYEKSKSFFGEMRKPPKL